MSCWKTSMTYINVTGVPTREERREGGGKTFEVTMDLHKGTKSPGELIMRVNTMMLRNLPKVRERQTRDLSAGLLIPGKSLPITSCSCIYNYATYLINEH